ncbi:MAG: hypothetical protein C5B51_18280 [Terriglobia bacterium]|nr:MAG: hypothetical protein C5B51_18280 [Terriglobia bacterium]
MTMWNEELGLDRRTKHRFALERELRYKVFENDRVVASGVGRTINISSRGVAFECGPVKPGALVELSIGWPVLLGETCLVRLIVMGRVVRAGKYNAACTIDRYDFRTQAKVSPNPLPAVNNPLRRWVEGMNRELKTVSVRT